MDLLLLLPLIAAFLTCVFIMPLWIRKATQIGLVWDDMNKIGEKKVAGSGGIVVVLAFLVGTLIFVAYKTFYLQSLEHTVEIFAMITSLILLAGTGLIDDLFGWQQGGLSIKSRIVLVLLSSVPLAVINAGRDTVSLPLIGQVDLGLLYPVVLIPLGILGASATFNIFAGFNGLEAGQGVLLLSALGVVAFYTGNSWLAVIAVCMIVALLGFLLYNFYPARVFPGDSLTYIVGGLIASLCILGNFEKIGFFFFIPYIIEAVLKTRGRLKKYSFGKPNKDGTLDLRYDKFYSLNHVAIAVLKKTGARVTEKRVVYLLWAFQLVVILIGFLVFSRGIFG